jgi:hypothetical protein
VSWKAANAAKNSADAVIFSNEPQLQAGEWEFVCDGPEGIARVRYEIRNFGSTPGWITGLRSKVVFREEDVPWPQEPDFSSKSGIFDDDARGLVIPPKEFLARWRPLEGQILGDKSYRQLQSGRGYIHIYGVVEFDNFVGRPDAMAFSATYRIVGPAVKDTPQRTLWVGNVGSAGYHYHHRRNQKKK